MKNTKKTDEKFAMVKVTKLVPSIYNPRKMSDFDFEKLKASIQKFGMPVPIIANSNPSRFDNVIGGHQRLKAAMELGWTEVPVKYVNLSEKDEKILNLSLNRITGEFDNEMLKSVFEGFSKKDFDITGFYQHEIDKIMKEVEDLGKDFDEKTLEIKHICPKCGYKF